MLDLCLSNTQAIRIRGLNLSLTGVGVAFPLHHGGVLALKGSVPPPSILFSWDARGTCSTKSTVTEFVERVLVVTRRLDFFYILICCFTSNVGSRIHVETVSYLITLFLGKSSVGSLQYLVPIHLAGILQLAFLRAAEEGKIHERQTRGSELGLFAYKADMRLTELPRLVFGFQKCGGGRGQSMVPIKVQISS